MDWADVADAVGKMAPAVGGLLGGPAGGAIGNAVASVLGVAKDDPDAVAKALESDPKAAVKLKKLEIQLAQTRIEARSRAHAADRDAENSQQAELQKTQRDIIKHGSAFNQWPSMIGWVMAFAFGAIAAAIAWGIFQQPRSLPESMDAIVTLLVTMAAVLGINIHTSSKDRQARMGFIPKGLFDGLRRDQ